MNRMNRSGNCDYSIDYTQGYGIKILRRGLDLSPRGNKREICIWLDAYIEGYYKCLSYYRNYVVITRYKAK